jgi:hypothetical protein
MENFEKLGSFYLGKSFDLEKKTLTDDLILYDSKDLTTHAVCVGMTGSGKTGLGIALIEEAAMDGIPSIVVDPKGDMGNLALTFPDLRGEDFLPWINADEAAQKSLSVEKLAEEQASFWRKGLESWGEGAERIRRFREAARVSVYTPGSTAGLPVSILKSFQSPGPSVREEADLFQDMISTAVSGLLGLAGIQADPIQSREHILLSNVLQHFWKAGKDLDLPTLISSVQTPPFAKVGVLDVESFFPSKDRFELAIRLNNLLASPSFQGWLEGVPLDMGGFLHTPQGKPRISVFSISHLSDAERIFFLSLLLNQTIGWMRSQPGTTSLRAILYIDELFGFMPPVANPATKKPLLTLFKQARAFGLGLVVATQNPVDLDYKGLSNAGTWLIGRLQTERDRDRVLDGLAGVSGAKAFDRGKTSVLISGLGKRVFLMHNVHENGPAVFGTRWTMSYLAGPMMRDQIKQLRQKDDGETVQPVREKTQPVAEQGGLSRQKPVLPSDVSAYFFPVRASLPQGSKLAYRLFLFGQADVLFSDPERKIDYEASVRLITPVADGPLPVDWDKGTEAGTDVADLEKNGVEGAVFTSVPSGLNKKAFAGWEGDFAEAVFRNQRLELWQSPSSRVASKPGESEKDFRLRLSQNSREDRDAWSEVIRKKYAQRISTLEDRIRRAEDRAERESAQSKQQKLATAVSIGATLLGAFLGRKTVSQSTISRAGTVVRNAGRIGKESEDASRARDDVQTLKQELETVQAEFERELQETSARRDALSETLESVVVRPKKSGIAVKAVHLIWAPFRIGTDGAETEAWR